MQPKPKSALSAHRLARLNQWARLWFAWVAGAFMAWWNGGAHARARDLDRAARIAARILLANAIGPLPPRVRRVHHRHGRLKPVSLKAAVGAKLWRALRARDARTRLGAILAALTAPARHIAHLRRRLRGGLTRLRVILPARTAAPLITTPPMRPCAFDTS